MTRRGTVREFLADLVDYALVSVAITCGAIAAVIVFVGIPAWLVTWAVSQ
jgi:hypothetical protein